MVNRNGVAKPIFAMVCLVALFMSGFLSSEASAQQRCQETDPELFSILTNSIVQPYIPPLDRNGNTLLSDSEIYNQKSQHYYTEYQSFEPVTISLQRFAAVTENNPTALENFESKITVLGPNCEKIGLYRNKLIGEFSADFNVILDIVEMGMRVNNEGLVLFARNQLKPNSMSFDELLDILSNDLSLNRNVITEMIEPELRAQFFGGKDIPLNSMAEFALLAFSARGGKLITDINEIFIFAPDSIKGLMNSPNTILLTSDGSVQTIPNFDYLTATSMLNRLGLGVNVITLSDVLISSGERCTIDQAGWWTQIINGSKYRRCPFSDMVQMMIEDNTFHLINDYKNQYVVIQKIRRILNRGTNGAAS